MDKNKIDMIRDFLMNNKIGFRQGSRNQRFFDEFVNKGKDFDELKKNFGLSDKETELLIINLNSRANPDSRRNKKAKKTSSQEDVKVEEKQEDVKVEKKPKTSKTTKRTSRNIPEFMRNFVPKTNGYKPRNIGRTTDVATLKRAYDNKHFVLLQGETGAGKTFLSRELAYQKKVPYMRVNMTGATTPDDLIGQWIPNPDPSNPSKYVWQDGVLTTFFKHGGVFVVDEINMTPANILSLLHGVAERQIEDRKIVLTQKQGEVINAHPDFFMVATMNPDYEGTNELNPALKSRFRVFEMGYDEKLEQKLGIDPQVSNIAKTLRSSDEIITPVSTRDLLSLTEDLKIYGIMIAKKFFLDKFQPEERSVVREILSISGL